MYITNLSSVLTGATMYQYYIKIVPTMRVLRDGSIFHSNQFSVTKHAKVRYILIINFVGSFFLVKIF